MAGITRRTFTKLTTMAGAAATVGGLGFPSIAKAAKGRVVVVGGGFGGATCAKYLRRANSALDVTLIEKDT